MWNTELVKKIGLQFPIIQAPMAGGATTPELIASVSNAGGLGSLGAGYMTPHDISQAIIQIRDLTNKPFAVNLFIPEVHEVTPEEMQKACNDIYNSCIELNIKIPPLTKPYTPSFEEQIQVLIEEKIPVFSFTFGTLDSTWISKFKKNNTILVGTATTLAEARILEKSGIDFIVAQGSEAGGHRGTFLAKAEDALIALNSLIPQLVNKIKIPIIAAGGIMNGEGISTVLNLGASGVQMGTAFLTCAETGIPKIYKNILLSQYEDNTVLTRAFSGKFARGIPNKFIERMQSAKNILDYPIQNALTKTMRRKAVEVNNTDFMSLWSGQSTYLCRGMSANELMKALVFEAKF